MRTMPLVRLGGSLALTALVLLTGCGAPEDLNAIDDAAAQPDDAAAALAKPTFTAVRTKVLATCGGPVGCHRRAFFGGGLDLTDAHAYKSLVGAAASLAPAKLRVKPGDAANSFLVQKLTNQLTATEGSAMPRSEGGHWTQIPADQLSLVKRWIAAGAPNN